jgi:hypothetical protein
MLHGLQGLGDVCLFDSNSTADPDVRQPARIDPVPHGLLTHP